MNMEQNEVVSFVTWPYWLAIGLLVVLALFLGWKYYQECKKSKTSLPCEVEDENIRLKEKLQKALENTATLYDWAKEHKSLVAEMERVFQAPTSTEKINKLHEALANAHTWPRSLNEDQGMNHLEAMFNEMKIKLGKAEVALERIKKLQEQIDKFYAVLYVDDEIIDNVRDLTVRSELLALSTMMIDVLQSVDNINYIEGHQGINLKILNSEMTESEAEMKAEEVTAKNSQTPRWAQVFQSSLSGCIRDGVVVRHVDSRLFFLNGYKFRFN